MTRVNFAGYTWSQYSDNFVNKRERDYRSDAPAHSDVLECGRSKLQSRSHCMDGGA